MDSAHALVRPSHATSGARVASAWLLGLLVLLPVNLISLPLNMDVVDVWILLGLPLMWFVAVPRPVLMSPAYLFPMWLILAASLASTFPAAVPRSALVVVLKETYVFVWFFTLVLVLARLHPATWRMVLRAWAIVALLHGVLILAQFAVPEFWRLFAAVAGRSQEYSIYRPSGLFVNANSAAFFQLLGFVPLALVRPSARMTAVVGPALFCTMIATGSMGALLAFMVGLAVATLGLVVTGHGGAIVTSSLRLAITFAVLGGALVLVVRNDPAYRHHLEEILIGRADRSSDGRFDLWQRGIDVLEERRLIAWGVGPENFRFVDFQGKQLHNDMLAFLVERGLFGALGLVLFAAVAVIRAGALVAWHARAPSQMGAEAVVFLAALAAALVESITHQTFHFRALWLVLALQEAVVHRAGGVPTPR